MKFSKLGREAFPIEQYNPGPSHYLGVDSKPTDISYKTQLKVNSQNQTFRDNSNFARVSRFSEDQKNATNSNIGPGVYQIPSQFKNKLS
jgi:hypothetical protein